MFSIIDFVIKEARWVRVSEITDKMKYIAKVLGRFKRYMSKFHGTIYDFEGDEHDTMLLEKVLKIKETADLSNLFVIDEDISKKRSEYDLFSPLGWVSTYKKWSIDGPADSGAVMHSYQDAENRLPEVFVPSSVKLSEEFIKNLGLKNPRSYSSFQKKIIPGLLKTVKDLAENYYDVVYGREQKYRKEYEKEKHKKRRQRGRLDRFMIKYENSEYGGDYDEFSKWIDSAEIIKDFDDAYVEPKECFVVLTSKEEDPLELLKSLVEDVKLHKSGPSKKYDHGWEMNSKLEIEDPVKKENNVEAVVKWSDVDIKG